jgi:hypothetical protein
MGRSGDGRAPATGTRPRALATPMRFALRDSRFATSLNTLATMPLPIRSTPCARESMSSCSQRFATAAGSAGQMSCVVSKRKARSVPRSYQPVDTKLAKETRGGTILQLALYSELLSHAQGLLQSSSTWLPRTRIGLSTRFVCMTSPRTSGSFVGGWKRHPWKHRMPSLRRTTQRRWNTATVSLVERLQPATTR